MRKIYFLLLTILFAAIANAQLITNYTFTATSGTYTALAGGTVVPSLAGDDVNSAAPIPFGFTFYYMGVPYTSATANSNGWLSFNSSPTVNTVDMRTNNLATAVAGIHPLLAPCWDDLDGRTTVIPNPVASYLTTGAAGSRVFTFEWLNWAPFAATVPNISFQVRLYEATGVIEYYYRQEASATNFTSASCGISNSTTSFASLSAFSAAPTVSNAVSTNTLTTRPATGQVYTFTPPAAPAAPTGLSFTNIGAGGMTLNWTDNATTETGYAIFRSLDGINYTNIAVTAANATSYVATGLAVNTLYFWQVVAVNEGNASSPLSGSQSTTASCTLSGTRTVGPTGNYLTLTAAVADVVLNGLTAPLVLELQTTYTGAGETFPITIYAIPCGSPVNTLTIRPATGASGLVITSANATATIDMNGANYVTIDGRPGGTGTTSQLTISNTATGTAVDMRFINDASNNTVTYCTLLGSTSATNGVVSFSTGAITGNDNNTISNNSIGVAGANFPLNGVFSLGTSAVIDNSANVINANNIFDVFSATAIYNGISLSTGNSGWTISNNRIYQTAARTVTTANTETGITVNSGNGYTISGNVIGYASAAATGTMTLNSTVALRYIGINGSFTAGGTANSIQGNTIASITLTTSSGATTTNGILCGINITSGNANIGTVTGNTIGATTGTGSLTATATTSGGLLVGINTSSTGTLSIQNNTMGAWTCSGTTAAVAGSITGINVSGVAASMTISGNTIGNTTSDNMRGGTSGLTTGSSLVSGINLPSTSTICVVSNNTVRNLSSFGTGTAGFVRGIQTAASGTTTSSNISDNTVINLTSDNANVSFGNGQLAAVGIYFAAGLNAIIDNNAISNISLTNTTTTGTNAAGISVAAALGTTVSRNKIFDISNASTSTSVTLPGTASGIFVRGHTAGTPLSFINNMIALGDGETTNTCFFGIWSANSNGPVFNNNVYFNSISITGTAASGAQPSFCFLRGDLSATARTHTVDVRNNIFSNTRSGGTGKHYAISNNYGATVSTTGWGANASNYNVLNSASPATIGFWTADQTFAGWQTASASDANSLSGVSISYTNTVTGDLHISSATSPIEGAGILIPAVTVDYDNQTRATLSPTDIGADAGNFLNYPIMTYTPLSNICATGARTLTTTITDVDGVPTAGVGLPVLYWRINAGAYTGAAATFLGADQYQFTFGAGAVIGDVVSYYIAAQDNLGNAGSSPSGGASGFSINPPAASTPPASPNTYTLLPTLSGTYTVGVGGNYTTLTAAANAYNNSCLGGPVLFSLIDATYPSETFPINFDSNPDASATNTLTIKPTGNTTISGSTLSTIIQLNGTDYITIDGSSGSTVNSICPPVSATRNLTIQNTNTTSFAAVVWLNTVTTPAVNGVTNCTIKNCIVIGGSNVNTAAGIGIGALPLISGGIDNDFNRIENNDIRLCRFGIYVVGQSAANKNEGNIISQNILTAASPNNIGEGGIFSAFENNLTVSGNEIDNIVRTASPDSYGINLGYGVTNGIGTASAAIADAIGNATISFNKIGVITNSGTFAAAGIALGNTVSGIQLISNNTISGVAANGTASDFSVGLWLEGGTGTTNVFNNTIAMQGTQPGASSGSQTSTALGIRTLANPININNNILSNTQIGAAAGTTTRFVAFALGYSSPYTGLASNYNDLYAAGAGPGTYHVGLTGSASSTGTSRPTLAAWQTETGGDANSKNVLPVFTSLTDLHLVNTPLGTNWCLNGSGINLASVTNDIDCQARSNPPDIGADEFTPLGDAVATPSSQTVCTGVPITTIVLTGTAASYNWTRDNNVAATGIAASGTGNISGTLTNTTASPVTVTFTITPVDAGGCFGPSITATVTITPNNTITLTSAAGTDAQTVCINTAITNITYSTTGATGATFSGLPAGVNGNWAADVVTISGPPSAAGTFNYTVTLTGGCGVITANGSITVTPDNTITLTSAPGTNAQTVCINTPVTNITYSTTGATGATFSGLPAGVNGNWAANVVTISGTPSASGTFNYTVTLTGGCGVVTANGSITVTPNNTITLTSAAGTNAQSLCIGSPITNITYSTTGATGANFSGLPAGVTGNWAANVVTISGTPGGTGVFNYTVTLTGGCGVITANGSITVNPLPTVSGVVTEPTTCASSDGGIDVTVSGTPGPYSYSWSTVGGSGIVNGVQDQTTLSIGQYTVVVTDQGTGCQQTAVFNLVGPGGCGVCPTMGSLTTNPSPAVCDGSTVTLTASGLTSMGVSYGITFIYSAAALADPYSGGTVIATVPNGSLGGGGTTATTNTVFPGAGNYFIYAILSPLPVNPACRPSVQTTLTVNPIPNAVATPASQTRCSGVAITTIVLSGAVGGTTYTWTRDNTVAVTGIAASGSGNISGTLTNTTAAPVTVTFTITPTANGCPGPTTTATVLVNPTPNAVATPASQTICSATAITPIVLTGAVSGTTFTWTRNNTVNVTGIAASGSGSPVTGTLTNITNVPQTVTFTITPTANGCTGPTTTATVLVNPTPGVVNPTLQVVITGNGGFADEITWTLTNSLNVVILSGGPYGFNPPATFSGTTPSVNAPYSFFIEAQGTFNDNSCLWEVRCNGVAVASGCIRGTQNGSNCANVGTLTVPNISGCNPLVPQTICSGTAITPMTFTGTVAGTTFNWTRDNVATVTGIAASGTGTISGTLTNTTTSPITVTFTVTPTANGCPGAPFNVTVLVNPAPTATATPSSQTICSGTALTPIVLTSNMGGTTYAWTRSNTANVTGIAASGSGTPISGTLTNTTTSQQITNFTIIPTAGGCAGTSIIAAVTVQAPLTIVCPANITVNAAAGTCAANVSYPAATVTGTPAPVVTYSNPSGSSFPVGTTTVTVTATNSCGTVNCSFTITVLDVQIPNITSLTNRTVCVGSSATFTAVSTFAVSYQWQIWNGSAWVNIAGATASSFTVNNVTFAMNANSYRVLVTGPCGTVSTSNHAVLYVNQLPTIAISSNIAPQLLPTQFVTLTATGNPAGGSFVWFKNNVVIPGATASTLGPLTVLDAGTYKVRYTDANGCVNTSADLVVSALLTGNLYIYPNPNTGQFHVRFFNAANEEATITVYNYLGAIVYQKKHGTGPLQYSVIDVDLGQRLAIGTYLVDVRNSQGLRIGAKLISVGRQ